MSVIEINKALDTLSPAERLEVAAHLNTLLFNWPDDDWDRQMANDPRLESMISAAEIEDLKPLRDVLNRS